MFSVHPTLFLVSVNWPGGSLEYVVGQDGCLREDVVRKFGWDLVKGLKYIHELGIILSDLNPAKVWIHIYFFISHYNKHTEMFVSTNDITTIFAIFRFSWMEVKAWSTVTSICPKPMERHCKISLRCSPSVKRLRSKITGKHLKMLGKDLKVKPIMNVLFFICR